MGLRSLRFEGEEILRKVGRKIDIIDDRIKELSKDMIETMYHEDGVGLAAQQIGIMKQIAVIQINDTDKPRTIINPEILEMKGIQQEFEGCLSVPGFRGRVDRPEWVKVKYTDLDGNEVIEEATGLLARAFCHEIDHLNATLYIDKAYDMQDIYKDE